MIDGLLSYARISTHGENFESVDMHTLTNQVTADLRDQIEECGGDVHVGDLPVIEADPIQMSQLLSNLITNGLKFHRPDVPPKVTVMGQISDSVQGSQMLEITIQDNGVGFDENDSNRIFSMLERLHGRSEYPGSGIGLALCRRIAERHGGKITATSTPGKGSTFTVSLPIVHDRTTTHTQQPAL